MYGKFQVGKGEERVTAGVGGGVVIKGHIIQG